MVTASLLNMGLTCVLVACGVACWWTLPVASVLVSVAFAFDTNGDDETDD